MPTATADQLLGKAEYLGRKGPPREVVAVQPGMSGSHPDEAASVRLLILV